ncbi:hypothetical protein BJP25_18040 [Actinokineospora bangkokensis]|uniref:Uncharacterized protein n=1 Tax=Actinokineospora bangkokensis TaxID=1193682 RepID=A0A1Q9LMX3_9PSEU|nr:hypothetical protein BJP25_18040 [Actinokineospora bangkokensis]
MNPAVVEIIARRSAELRAQLERATRDDVTPDGLLRLLKQLKDHPPGAPGPAPTPFDTPDEPGETTRGGVQAAFDRARRPRNMSKGGNQAGWWEDRGTASGARYKGAERAQQMLAHLSELLLQGVKSAEVEAMWVNDRVVVSANEARKVTELVTRSLAQVLAASKPLLEADYQNFEDHQARRRGKMVDLGNALTQDPTADTSAGRSAANGAERLGRLELDLGEFPSQREAVEGMLATLRAELLRQTAPLRVSAAEAGTWMADDAHRHRVLVVGAAATNSHAEQNLVYALVRADHRDKTYIAGGKRPCTSCWVTMELARRQGFDIVFNPHRGGSWEKSATGGLEAVARALGFDDESIGRPLVAIMAQAGFQRITRTRGEKGDLVFNQWFRSAALSKTNYTRGTSSDSESDAEDETTAERAAKRPPRSTRKRKQPEPVGRAADEEEEEEELEEVVGRGEEEEEEEEGEGESAMSDDEDSQDVREPGPKRRRTTTEQ